MPDELKARRNANGEVRNLSVRIARGGFIVSWQPFVDYSNIPMPMTGPEMVEQVCNSVDDVVELIAEVFK